ncbi:MAG: response regulator [Cytophagales bacterium]|nr:MAG: response regulator [Cytophagales bacterium]
MNSSKMIIYMADDDADDRYFMRQSLQKICQSLTLVEAEDGTELLTMLETRSRELVCQPVNLILLDINMPKMNGFETLTALKANPLLRHIPTVIVSTSDEPDQLNKAYQRGASGFVKKPDTYEKMDQVAHSVCHFCSGSTSPFVQPW